MFGDVVPWTFWWRLLASFFGGGFRWRFSVAFFGDVFRCRFSVAFFGGGLSVALVVWGCFFGDVFFRMGGTNLSTWLTSPARTTAERGEVLAGAKRVAACSTLSSGPSGDRRWNERPCLDWR